MAAPAQSCRRRTRADLGSRPPHGQGRAPSRRPGPPRPSGAAGSPTARRRPWQGSRPGGRASDASDTSDTALAQEDAPTPDGHHDPVCWDVRETTLAMLRAEAARPADGADVVDDPLAEVKGMLSCLMSCHVMSCHVTRRRDDGRPARRGRSSPANRKRRRQRRRRESVVSAVAKHSRQKRRRQ